MLDYCANPLCAKPLHYLRDGKVFTFDTAFGSAGADGRRLRRTQHYWLCGDCSTQMVVECTPEQGIAVHALSAHSRGGYIGQRAIA